LLRLLLLPNAAILTNFTCFSRDAIIANNAAAHETHIHCHYRNIRQRERRAVCTKDRDVFIVP